MSISRILIVFTMKRPIYMLIGLYCMTIIFSCSNNGSNKPIKEEDSLYMQMKAVENLKKKAASSKERVTELPLGFQFGMTKKESERHLKVYSAGNYYKLDINSRKYIVDINPSYHNGRLYKLRFIFLALYVDGHNGDKFIDDEGKQKIHEYLINKYKTYELIKYDFGGCYYVWNKGNLIIRYDTNVLTIEYIDESVDYPLTVKQNREAAANERQRVDAMMDEAIEINSAPSLGGPSVTDESDAIICAKDILRQRLPNSGSLKILSSSVTMNDSRSAYKVTLKYSAKNAYDIRVVAVATVLVRVRDGAGKVISNVSH